MSEDGDQQSWIPACRVDEVPDDEGYRVDAAPPIAVFKLDDGFFAIADTCSHGQFSLADGYVDEEGRVECVGHMAKFCIRDGRALTLPATEDVRSFRTRVVDGVVEVSTEDRR